MAAEGRGWWGDALAAARRVDVGHEDHALGAHREGLAVGREQGALRVSLQVGAALPALPLLRGCAWPGTHPYAP